MTRFTILALTTFAALMASDNAANAADAKAQGNRPQTSQIDGNSNLFRLVVVQGESNIIERGLQFAAQSTVAVEVDELPEVADYTDAPSELWYLRPVDQPAEMSVAGSN